MYREKLDEFRREKRITHKKWSEESGVSIDTISRIIHPDNPEKDSPKVNTLDDLCKALGRELWEIFYFGDTNLVTLQTEVSTLQGEITTLKAEMTILSAERDALAIENGVLKNKVETLRDKIDTLNDEIITILKHCISRDKTVGGGDGAKP